MRLLPIATAVLPSSAPASADNYQWQIRAIIRSTASDPDTGADLDNGRPSAPFN